MEERKIIDLTEEINNKKKSEFEEQLANNPDLQYKKYADSLSSISDINADIAHKKNISRTLLNQIDKICSSIMDKPEDQDMLLKAAEAVLYRHTTQMDIENNKTTKGYVVSIVEKFTDEEVEEIFKDFDVDEKLTIQDKKDFIGFLLETKDLEKVLKNSQAELEAITEEFNTQIEDILSELDSVKYMEEIKEQIDNTEDEEEKKKLINKLNDLYGISDLSIISNKIKNKGYKQLLKESSKKKNLLNVTKKALKKLAYDPKHTYPSQKVFGKLFRALVVLFKDLDKARVITYVYFRYIEKLREIKKEDARFIIFFAVYTLKASYFEEDERNESYFYNKLKDVVNSIDITK